MRRANNQQGDARIPGIFGDLRSPNGTQDEILRSLLDERYPPYAGQRVEQEEEVTGLGSAFAAASRASGNIYSPQRTPYHSQNEPSNSSPATNDREESAFEASLVGPRLPRLYIPPISPSTDAFSAVPTPLSGIEFRSQDHAPVYIVYQMQARSSSDLSSAPTWGELKRVKSLSHHVLARHNKRNDRRARQVRRFCGG